MWDSNVELEGDFEEIEGDAIITNDIVKQNKYNTKVINNVSKRKSVESAGPATSSKLRRFDSEKSTQSLDRKPLCPVQNQKNHQENEAASKKSVPEDELLALDSRFAENMFNQISLKLQPKAFGGYRTKVCISPVLMQDMADSAMQQLIKSQQLNLSFCFKGQAGKFRKKKGYAEVHIEKDKEWHLLLRNICQVNFQEKKINIQISIIKVSDSKLHAKGSFVMHLNRPEMISRLLATIKEEDSRPVNKSCYLSLSEVPDDTPLFNLRTFFPFLPTMSSEQCKPIKSKKGFKGPIRMCYKDLAQVEAVNECFSTFVVNDFSLKVQKCNQGKETSHHRSEELQSPVRKEKNRNERVYDADNAINEDSMQEEEEEKYDEEAEEVDIDEDDLSSAARDLCTDMRESLNKLKQMETNDPNIQKILEFQAQLAQLQKTLLKPNKKANDKTEFKELDPWSLDASDRQKPQFSVQEEMKALREQEEKRRANWAKKMIEDVKQNSTSGSSTGKTAKFEAQKLLQAREERLRQKKEEEERKKKEEELERQKKEEEKQRKEEEEKKKAEEEKKRQEKNLKEGIAQIVLPFQDAIKSENIKKEAVDKTIVKVEKPAKTIATSNKLKTPEKNTEKVEMIWESIYLDKLKNGRLADLPANFRIQLRFYEDRACPVIGCSNKRYFKKRDEFVSHWQIFHQDNVTVRFCPKCSAYFANTMELEDHLRTRHNFGRSQIRDMVQNARQKMIRNPSFRDPGLYSLSI